MHKDFHGTRLFIAILITLANYRKYKTTMRDRLTPIRIMTIKAKTENRKYW